MDLIEHFFSVLNCYNRELVFLKLLSINELNAEKQHLVIKALGSIDAPLLNQALQHSLIWDQLIRCYGKQNNEQNPLSLFVDELNAWKKQRHITGHHQQSPTVLSKMRIDLENYHKRLQRDNITLRNEQRLMKQLLLNQEELLSFLNNLYFSLTEWLTSSEAVRGEKRNFIEKRLLYSLQVKRDELMLQISISKQGIANLELIQNNNRTLLSRISDLLINALDSLKISSEMINFQLPIKPNLLDQ